MLSITKKQISTMLQRVNICLVEQNIPKCEFYERCGISSGAFSQWNTGRTVPTMRSIQTMADVLGVEVDYLLGLSDTQSDIPRSESSADELISYLQELKDRPEMQMLFKSCKNASKEQIMNIVTMIEGFKND